MTGPEHYREAERWLKHAEGTYLDTEGDAGPRENYATDGEWMAALEEGAEHHELVLRETTVFAALGQVHTLLAKVALTALSMPLEGQDDSPSLSQEDYDEWSVAIELEGKQGTEQATCSQCPREVRPGRTYCSTYCRNLDDRHDADDYRAEAGEAL